MTFCIDKIDGDLETGNDFWGILVNYQISKYGLGLTLSGCHQEVVTGDNVLWAVIPGPYGTSVYYLKVTPAAVTVKVGAKITATVTDGKSGVVVQNATTDGKLTGAIGKATLSFAKTGFFQYKATKVGDVGSNVFNVTVTS